MLLLLILGAVPEKGPRHPLYLFPGAAGRAEKDAVPVATAAPPQHQNFSMAPRFQNPGQPVFHKF